MFASHTYTLFVSAPDAAKSGLAGLLLVYPNLLQVGSPSRLETFARTN